ncbi:MAG: hypothetical protein ABI686_06945 [Acidobacteriota bacterium]
MEKNHSPFAIIEIGGGIIGLLIAASSFILQDVSITTFHLIFLGVALLLYGLSNNSADKSKRGKMMVNAASVCLIFAAILGFFDYYYRHK